MANSSNGSHITVLEKYPLCASPPAIIPPYVKLRPASRDAIRLRPTDRRKT